MKTIIYYRKSTDRDDKQANSLEHQLGNCRRIAESNSFDVVKEIGESRSAKTEWTRPWFNELVKICKTWKIDYIIIDEPKRLSRNNIDTSRMIDLMDKKLIKGILWTSREYRADNSRDKFLLQLDLSLSKMDNEDRAKDVKDKMTTWINNTWRFLWKAPYWYKNITIKKWHKDIIVDKEESKIVKEIFALRLENKAFNTIWIILKEKYWNKITLNLNPARIQKLVNKKFYYWVFMWEWKEIIWSHKPLISKETYDKANWIVKWVSENEATIKKVSREHRKHHLKWFIRDTSWILLTWYTQKGISYYWNQYRSDVKVCMNENKLFDKIWDYLKQFDVDKRIFSSIDRDIILDLLKQDELENWNESFNIDFKIVELKEKQDKLLDMKLDEKISEEIFLLKNNKIVNEIKELEDAKGNIKNHHYEEKTTMLLELAGGFYTSYFKWDKELKTNIIRNLMLELFINTKKELQIEENYLFKSSKMLDLYVGTPNKDHLELLLAYMTMFKITEKSLNILYRN